MAIPIESAHVRPHPPDLRGCSTRIVVHKRDRRHPLFARKQIHALQIGEPVMSASGRMGMVSSDALFNQLSMYAALPYYFSGNDRHSLWIIDYPRFGQELGVVQSFPREGRTHCHHLHTCRQCRLYSGG